MSPQLSSNNDNTPEFGPARRGIPRATCSICKPARGKHVGCKPEEQIPGCWVAGGWVVRWMVGSGLGWFDVGGWWGRSVVAKVAKFFPRTSQDFPRRASFLGSWDTVLGR